MKRSLVSLATAGVVTATGIGLLSGCGSNGAKPAFEDATYSDEVAAETPELASEMSMDAAGVDGGADSRTDSQTDQQIIRTAYVSVDVDDVATGVSAIADLTADLEGQLQSQSVQGSGEDSTANMTVRVPASNLDTLLASIDTLGEVTSSSVDAQDVTVEVIDLEARITTLEESIDRTPRPAKPSSIGGRSGRGRIRAFRTPSRTRIPDCSPRLPDAAGGYVHGLYLFDQYNDRPGRHPRLSWWPGARLELPHLPGRGCDHSRGLPHAVSPHCRSDHGYRARHRRPLASQSKGKIMKLTAPRVTALAASAFIGCALLTGCSSSDDDASADCSIVEEGLDPDITQEQIDFACDLTADPLPQDEATAMIEDAGYDWRIGVIDGEPQAVTMDYRIDRLTLTVDDGLVTDGMWG